jgi:hypothetical protein
MIFLCFIDFPDGNTTKKAPLAGRFFGSRAIAIA